MDLSRCTGEAPPSEGRVALKFDGDAREKTAITLSALTKAALRSGDDAAHRTLTLDRPVPSSKLGHAFARGHREWRERVPFAVPTDPALLSYYPHLVHSAVLRTTNDVGVVAADVTPPWDAVIHATPVTRAARFAAMGLIDPEFCIEEKASHFARRRVLSRDVERGLTGVSLSKYSLNFLASSHRTYPGLPPQTAIV